MRLVALLVVVLAAATAALPTAGPVGAQEAPHNAWRYTRGGDAPPPAPVAKPMADGRTAYDTAYVPFAEVGGITLHHPSKVVEAIGFHQSNHEGAREQAVAKTAAGPVLLGDRGRLSGRHSAADVVVAPDVEIRSPVTGVVIRAGTYTLYCDHLDDYVVIAPDANPAWEVKVLHIDGVVVAAGDRVRAGSTMIAPRATVLPFRSQVDGHTASPAWPHTHIEVVDPSIPNVPNGGSGSGAC